MYKVRKKLDGILKKLKIPQNIRINLLKLGIIEDREEINESNAFELLEKVHKAPVNNSLSNLDISVNSELDLSIIVPTYNEELYINDCLSSLINQDTKYNYEILVVNDGSTDHTLNEVMKYKNNGLVKIIDKDNGGISSARNAGLANSQGRYISFVDSDDIVEPNFVESLVSIAEREDADIVQGNYQILGDLEKRQPEKPKVIEVKPFISLYGYPWGKIYKSDLFNNVKFPENFWFEDTMMMYRIWPKANLVYSISNVIYNYRITSNGATGVSHGNKKFLESLYITMQLLLDYKKVYKNNEFTMNIYEFTLKQMVMNFNRVNFLENKLLYASFLVMSRIINNYFPDQKFKTNDDKLKILEESFRKENYGLFVAYCLDN